MSNYLKKTNVSANKSNLSYRLIRIFTKKKKINNKNNYKLFKFFFFFKFFFYKNTKHKITSISCIKQNNFKKIKIRARNTVGNNYYMFSAGNYLFLKNYQLINVNSEYYFYYILNYYFFYQYILLVIYLLILEVQLINIHFFK